MGAVVDDVIREAAAETWRWGRYDPAKPFDARKPTRRLLDLAGAKLPDRTPAAILQRAHRIGARSYRPREAMEDWGG